MYCYEYLNGVIFRYQVIGKCCGYFRKKTSIRNLLTFVGIAAIFVIDMRLCSKSSTPSIVARLQVDLRSSLKVFSVPVGTMNSLLGHMPLERRL